MDKVQNVINRIRAPRNNKYVNETPVIRRTSDKAIDNVQLSTDGGGYVNKRGFIGWGYYMSRFSKGRLIDRAAGYGSRVQGTTTEAELLAVLDGIREAKRRAGAVEVEGVLMLSSPLRITLTTDCLMLIEGMHNFSTIEAHARNIQKIPQSQRTIGHQNKINEFSVWQDIMAEIEKDHNLVELSTQWIRSHVLDVIPEKDWPQPKDARSRNERNLIHLLYGNRNADDQASLGIRQGIKEAIDYFHLRIYERARNPISTYQKEMKKLVDNLKNSTTAVNIAIDYLATKDQSYLAKRDLRAMFAASVLPELKNRDLKDITSFHNGGKIGTNASGAITGKEQGIIMSVVTNRIEKTKGKYADYLRCEITEVPETFKTLCQAHELEWVEFNYKSREKEMRQRLRKNINIVTATQQQAEDAGDIPEHKTIRREHSTLFGPRP